MADDTAENDVNDDADDRDMTQRDLDEVDALAERFAAMSSGTEPATEPVPGPRPAPSRVFDPGSLVVGAWFVLVGLVAAVLGSDMVDDLPPIMIPISFAITGVALLLPKRPVGARERRDW